jgi:cell division protein FtsL
MLESHEKKLIYITAGIALAILLVVGLVIYPRYRAIVQANQQITEMRTKLETEYAKSKMLHRSQVNLSVAQKIAKDINASFLKKGEELKFIVEMENLAEKMAVAQKLSLGSSLRTVRPGLSAVDLNITAGGDLKNILKYIEELENSAYPLSILALNFNTGGPSWLASKGEPGVVTVVIKAEIYVQ